MLDQDAIVREERENLKRLQTELHEKLREAEIEISLERATIARQQAEIKDKIRLMELKNESSTAADGSTSNTGQPVRGRWLARLGLTDADRRPTRDDPGFK